MLVPACFHLQSSQSLSLANVDLNKSGVSKEWMGASVSYLVFFSL